VVGRLIPAARRFVDAAGAQPICGLWAEQQVVDATAFVAIPRPGPIIPPPIASALRIAGPKRVGQAQIHNAAQGVAAFGQKQRVTRPLVRRIDVFGFGDDVVVAAQHERLFGFQQVFGVGIQTAHPAQFVIVLLARCGIAVGQVDAAHAHTP